MNHQISSKDLRRNVEQELAGSYGQGNNKSLILRTNTRTMRAVWVVKKERRSVLVTPSIVFAVEKYNSLP